MYLLDTNVVSELRKAKSGKADANVVAWASSIPSASLFLSAISILELEMGILLLERRDTKQSQSLRRWLETYVLPSFEGRILAVDVDIARQCAQLHVPDPCSERDALIAATALVHRLVIVTHNVKDFKATEVQILDPWLLQGVNNE